MVSSVYTDEFEHFPCNDYNCIRWIQSLHRPFWKMPDTRKSLLEGNSLEILPLSTHFFQVDLSNNLTEKSKRGSWFLSRVQVWNKVTVEQCNIGVMFSTKCQQSEAATGVLIFLFFSGAVWNPIWIIWIQNH